MREYSEDTLIEQPAIALFAALGWATSNAFHESYGATGTLGRETSAEVVLRPRLRAALARLNPGLSGEALDLALEELARDRGALGLAQANREVHRLLKDGVRVAVRDDEGDEAVETVRVIDWRDPANNDFLLVSQFWVSGDIYKRRADLVGFVNGLPLVLVELKAAHKRLAAAYERNLTDYKATIPHLFWYNGLILLSNGGASRVGSLTAGWDHFGEWKRVDDEGERGVVSLETAIRGTCAPDRLLDLVENFTLFAEAGGGLVKLLAKNHQYLGVNNALARLGDLRANAGRLGVFWHTQGSGKSYSMIFFAQKALRTVPGNWTFVVVTDRQELDDQIYQTFARAGALTEGEAAVHAASGADLRDKLREDHRIVFTLIQKFHAPPGERHPTLSERRDIIVVTDEAHRSQYDQFALNMRNALPHAAFLGFTGTPLLAGEELTRAVFGDYVSVYDFRQSVEDGATVPLYYENRIPELQLVNAALDEDLGRLIEEAGLDEAQEARLEREFAREYHLITRDDRLERIAADIVDHFLGRGQRGKAMVVSIDKATAVRMYDKVRRHWGQRLADLRARLRRAAGPERDALRARIAYLAETDMAVVVSQAQNEVAEFAKKGLDIAPHRLRMVKEDLETKFKDPDDPFRLVFVTAMWMTGFDVPSLATMYLDKPLRNHTLMQTIARANRVHGDKDHGLIVDYFGVFRDLQNALAIYGAGPGGEAGGELPVRDKDELVAALRAALDEADRFCRERGVDPDRIIAAAGFQKVALLKDAVDALLVNDDVKRAYLALAGTVARRYAAILPDEAANAFLPRRTLFVVLAEQMREAMDPADITEVMDDIGDLLDESIAAEGYVIRGGDGAPAPLVDLSRIDFEALQAHFARGRKHTEAERLRGAINSQLTKIVRLNRTRATYRERFQRLIDEYNAGSVNVETFFAQLVALAKDLTAEERRGVATALSEEELAVFDLLTKPEPTLSAKEVAAVKQVARDLLATLKREKLALDWRKRQQARALVRLTIEQTLDAGLPNVYSADLYNRKCDLVYQHVYDAYYGPGQSVYALR